MSEEAMKIIKHHAEDAQAFSEALWEQGDKPNAQFQSGRNSGLMQALMILRRGAIMTKQRIPVNCSKCGHFVGKDGDIDANYDWYAGGWELGTPLCGECLEKEKRRMRTIMTNLNELTDRELAEKVAIEVMGWEKTFNNTLYRLPSGQFYDCKQWNPCNDWNDAFAALNALNDREMDEFEEIITKPLNRYNLHELRADITPRKLTEFILKAAGVEL